MQNNRNVTVMLVIALILSAQSVMAQIHQPVIWKTAVKKIDATTFEILMKAEIDKDWHIYAQLQPIGAVAFPTHFKFTPNPISMLVGKVREEGKKQIQRVLELGIEQYYYSDAVLFIQRVKLKKAIKTTMSGVISYMVCTNERCLPQKELPFTIKLN